MLCAYLELNEDEFLYFRENQTTILDELDPVQFMMPTPERSEIIEDLDKAKSIKIMNEIMNAASNTIK